MQIKSYWDRQTANWDGKGFINRKWSKVEEKKLKVTLDDTNTDKPIVKFHGGPTGFESYYLKDLLENPFGENEHDLFCICGGTINSWPRCFVKSRDLKEILEVFKNAT